MKLITDAHVHYADSLGRKKFLSILKDCGIERFTLQCISQKQILTTVPDALSLKSQIHEKIRVHGGFAPTEYFRYRDQEAALGKSLVRQAELLLQAGCDGIKLLEGKPDLRKNFPIPDFDSKAWEPFWSYAEENQIPITMHVNDPPDFWDQSKINPYALSRGWFYGADYINNEVQYKQMETVFQRHPDIRIQLAHFFFLSASLNRLRELLTRYSNLYLDITPGIEIFFDFSKNPEASRQFFVDFQDRILFGSDIGSRAVIRADTPEIDEAESFPRVEILRDMLERDDFWVLKPDGKYLYGIPDHEMRGLGLDASICEKIYSKNAAVFGQKQSAEVVPDRVLEWAEFCKESMASVPDIKETLRGS